jgi:hypothetical protein
MRLGLVLAIAPTRHKKESTMLRFFAHVLAFVWNTAALLVLALTWCWLFDVPWANALILEARAWVNEHGPAIVGMAQVWLPISP